MTITQQVNLYPAARGPARVPFSAGALAGASLAVFAVLMAIYGFDRWRTSSLEAEFARLEAERDAAVQSFARLKQSLPSKTKSALLQAEIAERTKSLERAREIAGVLAGTGPGRAGGFSPFLEGLARKHVEGLWLTGFRILNGGRDLELRGKAMRPELVPILVQRLGEEPVFAGLSFSVLRLERPEAGVATVNFTLRTAAAGEREG